MYNRFICYKTTHIVLSRERHYACPDLTYFLPSSVWLKDLVIFDVELNIQMEGIFHVRERFRKSS